MDVEPCRRRSGTSPRTCPGQLRAASLGGASLAQPLPRRWRTRPFAREFGRDAAPIRYPDPVWKVVDERFRKYVINNTPLRREWTGALWAEGPAWNGIGRYVVFSDVPNNRQMRWDEVTGTVTLLRSPSSFSNGNTFDFQGRQISCEQATARVVRYEWEGDPVVLAATYEGKLLNGPDDVVVHPADGGIIFTDPGYGSLSWYEGNLRELALPMSIYRIDAQSGTLTRLTDELLKPNGLCFSPDYRVLYVADSAPTDHPQEKARNHRLGRSGRWQGAHQPPRPRDPREWLPRWPAGRC